MGLSEMRGFPWVLEGEHKMDDENRRGRQASEVQEMRRAEESGVSSSSKGGGVCGSRKENRVTGKENRVMARKIKATDIPNGYVVLGPNGHNLLVDYDDNGHGSNQGTEVSLEGWPKAMLSRGCLLPTLIVLVHTVKGSGSMLVKRLQTREVRIEGESVAVTVSRLAKMGKLGEMVDSIWKEYMASLERKGSK